MLLLFVAFCFDIVKGCAYIEEKKFVHRDLAARNCLLTLKEYTTTMTKYNKLTSSFIILISIFFTNIALGADVTVEMLNRLDKESNVFEPKIVRVNPGDTVLWKATDKGHNVEFIKKGVPEGVGKFKSNGVKPHL